MILHIVLVDHYVSAATDARLLLIYGSSGSNAINFPEELNTLRRPCCMRLFVCEDRRCA